MVEVMIWVVKKGAILFVEDMISIVTTFPCDGSLRFESEVQAGGRGGKSTVHS